MKKIHHFYLLAVISLGSHLTFGQATSNDPKSELIVNYGMLQTDNLSELKELNIYQAGKLSVEHESAIVTSKYDVALAHQIYRRHGAKVGLGFYKNGRKLQGNVKIMDQNFLYEKTFVQRYLSFNLSHYYTIYTGKWVRCNLEHGFNYLSKTASDDLIEIRQTNWTYFLKLSPSLKLADFRLGFGVMSFLPTSDFSNGPQISGDFQPFSFGIEASVGYVF